MSACSKIKQNMKLCNQHDAYKDTTEDRLQENAHTNKRGFCVCWLYVDMCMSVYMCGHMMGVYVHTCVGLRLVAGVFLDHSTPYMSRQGLKLNLELTISDSLATQLAQRIPCLDLPHAGITGVPPCPPSIHVGFGECNSDLHAHMVSAPFTELFPQCSTAELHPQPHFLLKSQSQWVRATQFQADLFLTNYIYIWTPYSNEATFWQGYEFWETLLSNPVSRAMVESAKAVLCITH